MEEKTCSKCKNTFPLTVEYFFKSGIQPSGKQKWKPMCKQCESTSRIDYYNNTIAEVFPDLHCAVCGYNKCPQAIDFHHLEQDDKEFNISDARRGTFNKEKLIAELEKCVPLCCRCHREYHAGFIEL
ncbi:hypothetical protein rutana_111 [Salmonella phage rutana]|uniref:HNH endonuclease n=2 Tax=Markadamsvirinae TaxID=2732013 RepID=A0A6G8RL32_9CAUD|nr:hypothetical protein rutana_111 [Salmonella phage rutana]QKE54216.1 hypothetical protein ACSA001_0650 [Salmonella phage vB_SalS_SA001]